MTATRYTAPILALVLTMMSALQAQERRQGGPPPYDPSREVTVSGSVIGTEVIETPNDTQLVMTMTVEGKTMGVILGPAAWIQKKGFVFTKGATAEVVGLPGYRFNGNPALLPRSVKISAKTLTLRDATGKALWETIPQGLAGTPAR